MGLDRKRGDSMMPAPRGRPGSAARPPSLGRRGTSSGWPACSPSAASPSASSSIGCALGPDARAETALVNSYGRRLVVAHAPSPPSASVGRMKRCGNCQLPKPFSEFHRRGNGYQTWCKNCRRLYDQAYHRRNRERRVRQKRAQHAALVSWYRELKAHTPCADCGGVFHHAAMTWDHLPGARKRADVSSLLQRHSRAALLEEIAKCELVCANCHAARTFRRRRDVAQPG